MVVSLPRPPRPHATGYSEGLSGRDRIYSSELGIPDAGTFSGRGRPRELKVWTDRGHLIIELEGQEPPWLRPILDRLADILQLPENWNSYGARRVALDAVADALDVLGETMLETTPAPSIVATSRGGVQLEWHMRGIDLEVGVTPNGRLTAAYEDSDDGDEWDEEDGVSLERLASALSKLTRRS